jgi:hypothetical protein
MRSSLLTEVADWFHQTRDMLMWAGIALVGLVVALHWFGLERSSPIRAAEQSVREALDDPDLGFTDSRIHRRLGHRTWLVCGAVEGDGARPFAAAVKERRRRSPLSLIAGGDRVLTLAFPAHETLTPDAAALLADCPAPA